jgi:hypothetical protein
MSVPSGFVGDSVSCPSEFLSIHRWETEADVRRWCQKGVACSGETLFSLGVVGSIDDIPRTLATRGRR